MSEHKEKFEEPILFNNNFQDLDELEKTPVQNQEKIDELLRVIELINPLSESFQENYDFDEEDYDKIHELAEIIVKKEDDNIIKALLIRLKIIVENLDYISIVSPTVRYEYKLAYDRINSIYRLIYRIKIELKRNEIQIQKENTKEYLREKHSNYTVWLMYELGLIDYIFDKDKFDFTKERKFEIISEITGHNKETIKKYINYCLTIGKKNPSGTKPDTEGAKHYVNQLLEK